MKSCMKTCLKTNMYFLKLNLCKNVNDLNESKLAILNKYFN